MIETTFKSKEHAERFITAMQQYGKVYDGKFDVEYSAAFYILTSNLATWNKAYGYLSRYGIDIATMLEEVDFSGGTSVLIKLAGNLFNGNTHIDPLEFLRLDEGNFAVAMEAIRLRRDGYETYNTDFIADSLNDIDDGPDER